MTHIKTIGKLLENEANIWVVAKHEQVECPVCFDEHPISKFSMCKNGHLVHEKCLLQQIGASYSLGKTFQDDQMQICSICKGSVEDINCSPSFFQMLPLIIAKNYCKSYRPDVWKSEKDYVLTNAISRQPVASFNIKSIDKEVHDCLGDRKDMANLFTFYRQ